MSVIVNKTERKVSVVVKKAADGKDFKYEDFTPEQLEALKPNLSTDSSLYIDPDSGEIRANVSTYKQSFTWLTDGSKIWTLDFEPTNFIGIFRNGVETEEYTFTSPATFEFTGTLINEDVIKIIYEHFITQP